MVRLWLCDKFGSRLRDKQKKKGKKVGPEPPPIENGCSKRMQPACPLPRKPVSSLHMPGYGCREGGERRLPAFAVAVTIFFFLFFFNLVASLVGFLPHPVTLKPPQSERRAGKGS